VRETKAYTQATFLHAVYDGLLQVGALLGKSSNWLCVLDESTTCRSLKYEHHASYKPAQQHTNPTTLLLATFSVIFKNWRILLDSQPATFTCLLATEKQNLYSI